MCNVTLRFLCSGCVTIVDSMKNKSKVIAAVITVLALILIGIIAIRMFDGNSDEVQSVSQLTGLGVTPEVAERPVLAALFNNAPEARPQRGLDDAGIVFETVTEGGVTRYLAFYQEGMPEEIGPIRSLRPYFLDWGMGFDASLVHVGGSQEALEAVDERDAKSLDQFDHSGPYYRSDERSAPHNMYAVMQQLRDLQRELGHSQSQFSDIPRSDDAPAEDVAVQTVTIDFSTPGYETEFRYQATSNTYERYLAGEPHIDETASEPISVKNLIVVEAGEPVEAVGDGEAIVFKDGEIQELRWEQPSYTERITLLDGNNNEVAINRGMTWIAVVPDTAVVRYE